MAGRKQLPDLMEAAFGRIRLNDDRARDKEEALSRFKLSEERPKAKVVQMPTDIQPDLSEIILEIMGEMRLNGMARAYREQLALPEASSLSFEQRLQDLLLSEDDMRAQRRLKTKLRKAGMKVEATLADIDYQHARGLDKSQVAALADCRWIKDRQNLVIVGPVGMGKTYLACAFVHQACLKGYQAVYRRLPDLLLEMAEARRSGAWAKAKEAYAKVALLAIDDWALKKLDDEQRLDLLEILEDRYASGSTLVTARVPEDRWPAVIGESSVGEAIIDRLAPNAHRINLSGSSMRREYSLLPK